MFTMKRLGFEYLCPTTKVGWYIGSSDTVVIRVNSLDLQTSGLRSLPTFPCWFSLSGLQCLRHLASMAWSNVVSFRQSTWFSRLTWQLTCQLKSLTIVSRTGQVVTSFSGRTRVERLSRYHWFISFFLRIQHFVETPHLLSRTFLYGTQPSASPEGGNCRIRFDFAGSASGISVWDQIPFGRISVVGSDSSGTVGMVGKVGMVGTVGMVV